MAEWDTFKWEWLKKHEPLPDAFSWQQIMDATTERGSASKFFRGLDKAEFQNFAERGMRRIRQKRTERFYYVICNREIGVSGGIVTKIARLRWHSSNTIHGYPITEQELVPELLRHNREEYERFTAGV